MSAFRVWECDKCGVTNNVPIAKQMGCAPKDWQLLNMTVHAGGKGNGLDKSFQWDLCEKCAIKITDTLQDPPPPVLIKYDFDKALWHMLGVIALCQYLVYQVISYNLLTWSM